MKYKFHILTLTTLFSAYYSVNASDFVVTDAYRWHGDTITQGEFYAYSPNGVEIISNYSAQPGFRMPVDKYWKLSKDISSYPQLSTPNNLHTAIYNLGLEEMINAVEPDTTLRTGKEWAGVWTRDVSYSILLSMAYMQPEAAKISLMKKVSPTGKIIQDTGSGGAWPVSSDRMIWALAAYEVYKVTGEREWLEYIYPIIDASISDDEKVTHAVNGLVKGETSFIDWREQSYPRWMQTADIYESQALSTSVIHAQALRVLSEIALELGDQENAEKYASAADKIAEAINKELWLDDKGYYAMYNYGRNHKILNPRAETLGESLAILYDIAPADRAKSITENNPTTPFGAAIFFPQIADIPPYHNNSLWPWVASYWALANAKVGNEPGVLEAIGSVFRPAALFTTNKENFVLDNGDIATELNSSNMLWCLAGNLAITHKILFGINFEKDGLSFKPFIPKSLGEDRSLLNFPYRGAVLNITIKGYGNKIKEFTLNGVPTKPFIPSDIKGINNIVITMADNDLEPMKVNRTANVKAPLTPIARLSHSPELIGEGVPMNNLIEWNPIEYISKYRVLRDGQVVGETRTTSFAATIPGEYQVIGISEDGVESFASEPLNNYETFFFEMPGEGKELKSKEISYVPVDKLEGYHGNGFIEVDHSTSPVLIDVPVNDSGLYSISVIYANGNGPANTENKCAIRTVEIDGVPAGNIVMPHRGVANWNDWGSSNSVLAPLSKGNHTIGITFRPENENMNLATNHAAIDRIVIRKIK